MADWQKLLHRRSVRTLQQLVDRFGGRWDESFMRFSIRTGRDLAWRLAERLAAVEAREQRAEIAERDRETVLVARTIVRPWYRRYASR